MLQSEASGGSRTTNGMVVVMIELNEQMIDAWISDHREEMLEELMEWVRHPSVSRADLASPGAPYGPDCWKMLDFAMKRCREMGFRTEDHEGYCGSVWYGDAEDELGFYAHLDVVPEGENWIYQPYEPVVEKGFMIGRGCDDDKAPAIMGVYILRFLKEHGIKLNKTVRLMFGCAEETGMDDFASYLGKGGRVPDFGIVADGGFPVCFAEKGGWNADILVKKGADILDFRAGNVRNAVPGSASILLRGDAEELKKRLSENEASEKLFDDISKLSVAEGEEPGTVRVSATGKAGHAAFPDGADSAAIRLCRILPEIYKDSGKDLMGLALIRRLFEAHDGSGFGFACADEMSGKLTANAGVFSCEGDRIRILLDIRYPVTAPIGEMTEGFQTLCQKKDIVIEKLEIEKPFYMDPKDPRIQLLQGIYKELTGDEKEPYAMGGGTYSRVIPNAITFGPGMAHEKADFLPEGHGGAHGPDETLHIASMLKAFKIYLLSFLKLGGADVKK